MSLRSNCRGMMPSKKASRSDEVRLGWVGGVVGVGAGLAVDCVGCAVGVAGTWAARAEKIVRTRDAERLNARWIRTKKLPIGK